MVSGFKENGVNKHPIYHVQCQFDSNHIMLKTFKVVKIHSKTKTEMSFKYINRLTLKYFLESSSYSLQNVFLLGRDSILIREEYLKDQFFFFYG